MHLSPEAHRSRPGTASGTPGSDGLLDPSCRQVSSWADINRPSCPRHLIAQCSLALCPAAPLPQPEKPFISAIVQSRPPKLSVQGVPFQNLSFGIRRGTDAPEVPRIVRKAEVQHVLVSGWLYSSRTQRVSADPPASTLAPPRYRCWTQVWMLDWFAERPDCGLCPASCRTPLMAFSPANLSRTCVAHHGEPFGSCDSLSVAFHLPFCRVSRSSCTISKRMLLALVVRSCSSFRPVQYLACLHP